jgi:aerobic-type carbon monoxide dehydrogenase small subunit (CoxS/CutS family)
VRFTCNGRGVDVETAPDETLLNVLRERLGLHSVKDGCAPQGQCGCCTVLVDGAPRVACVTPATRVEGRSVTTLEGYAEAERIAASFVASGGSQCGFCTPGIIMRFAGEKARDVDRGLAAHLCRCTGWLTVKEALAGTSHEPRDLDAASRRAMLEGDAPQFVGVDAPLGRAGFADDTCPEGALVAVPAADGGWAVGESLLEARALAGKVQGRRTTLDARPPLLAQMPDCPAGGVQLATSWVEPAYLEPDASWCEPGGEPASPLANGGAFGGKVHSLAPAAARELADRFGRTVRVVYSREDVVRMGAKRAPIAAVAAARGDAVEINGVIARGGAPRVWPTAEGIEVQANWREVDLVGPPVSPALRAAGLAEQALLVSGALDRNVDVVAPSGARARAEVDEGITRVSVEVAAGETLDEIVLRSYAIGAAHMALGWVLREGIAVDPDTGEPQDLTIRSFGILRPAEMPKIDITILDDDAPARARSSDAVFAAVAAATWNAIGRPTTLPARAS